VNGIAFSPDGTLVATSGADGTLRVWQADTGASVAIYRPGRDELDAVAFSRDGRAIATAGAERVVSALDCEPCRPFPELLKLARSRVTRQLTAQERRQFLGEE
jgi:WD40 repeat protein